MPHNACRIRNDPKRQYNYYTLSEGKLQKSSKQMERDFGMYMFYKWLFRTMKSHQLSKKIKRKTGNHVIIKR